MGNLEPSTEADLVYAASCVTGIISLFASIITVRLVSSMKMNGYLQLVTAVAIVQIFVDLGHIMTFQNRMKTNEGLCITHGVLLIFGNLSATIWTNFISISVFYIVFFGKSLDIQKHFPLFFVLGTILPFILAVCAASLNYIQFSNQLTASCFLIPVKIVDGSDDADDRLYSARDNFSQLYNDIHYISLGLNGFIAIITCAKIFFFSGTTTEVGAIGRISMLSLSSTLSVAAAGKPSRRQKAIRELSLRLILYPFIEIFNEIFRIADAATANKNFALNLLHAIINGLLGTFFFIIFLMMQPKARLLLYNMLPSLCTNKSQNQNSSEVQINSHQVSWATNTSLNNPLTDAKTPLLAEMDEDQLANEIQNPSNIDDDDDMPRGSIRDSVRESEMRGSEMRGSSILNPVSGIRSNLDHSSNINL